MDASPAAPDGDGPVIRPGFITLWRQVVEDPLYQQKPFSKWQAKLDLVIHAEHQERTVWRGPQPIRVKRGQVLTAQTELSRRWGWDRETVGTFLRALRAQGEIEFWTSKDSATGYTLVTIVDFEQYQGHTPVTPIDASIDPTVDLSAMTGSSEQAPPSTPPSVPPSRPIVASAIELGHDSPDSMRRSESVPRARPASMPHPCLTGKEGTLRHRGTDNLLQKAGVGDQAGGGGQQDEWLDDGAEENWGGPTEEEFQAALRAEAEAELRRRSGF